MLLAMLSLLTESVSRVAAVVLWVVQFLGRLVRLEAFVQSAKRLGSLSQSSWQVIMMYCSGLGVQEQPIHLT